MNLIEVEKRLNEAFEGPLLNGCKRHIIFWYDEEGEFKDEIDSLNLNNVNVLKIDNNQFYLKYLIEEKETEGNILLYSPSARPDSYKNFLLDIEKYSQKFSANASSLILEECKIDSSLISLVNEYMDFFKNSKMAKKYKTICGETKLEEKLYENILSCISNLSQSNFDEFVRKLFSDEAKQKDEIITNVNKYFNVNKMYELLSLKYAECNSVDELVKSMLLAHLHNQVFNNKTEEKNEYFAKYKKYMNIRRITDLYILLDDYRNNLTYINDYKALANKIEVEFSIKNDFLKQDVIDYYEADTFKCFDELLIEYIIQKGLDETKNVDDLLEIINERKNKYWYSEFKNIYKCLENGLLLIKKYSDISSSNVLRIRKMNAKEFLELYTEHYCLIDTYYRKTFANNNSIKRSEINEKIIEQIETFAKLIEDYYTKFMSEIAENWSYIVSEDMTQDYSIPGVRQQIDFYNDYINNEKTFVIISDAFRYECAKELYNILKIKNMGDVTLDFMQSVIPSYTDLGMAALLPHEKIEILPKESELPEIKIDGKNVNGTEAREKILKGKCEESLAFQYDIISKMNSNELKETTSGKKVIYIYHNVIDARGDSAETEKETCSAADECIEELSDFVTRLKKSANATRIIVTADHGFIYRDCKITSVDKVDKRLEDTKYKTRFSVLSSKPKTEDDSTIMIDLKYIGEEGKIVLTPRGTSIFKRQGKGINYVHGGIMPQEIVVPVISFKCARGKAEEEYVEIAYTGSSNKITNAITYLDFTQIDVLTSDKKACTYKVFFEDGNHIRVCDEVRIEANVADESINERAFHKRFTFTIKDTTKKDYYMVIENENNGKELSRIRFTIDLAFGDDFGF